MPTAKRPQKVAPTTDRIVVVFENDDLTLPLVRTAIGETRKDGTPNPKAGTPIFRIPTSTGSFFGSSGVALRKGAAPTLDGDTTAEVWAVESDDVTLIAHLGDVEIVPSNHPNRDWKATGPIVIDGEPFTVDVEWSETRMSGAAFHGTGKQTTSPRETAVRKAIRPGRG